MQVENINNTSFGRIGFTNKAVKKAFYAAMDTPRFTSRNSRNRAVEWCFCNYLIDKENLCRHDRLFKIGMTQVKGKDYFTNAATNEILGTTKRGRQSVGAFLVELICSKNKKAL